MSRSGQARCAVMALLAAALFVVAPAAPASADPLITISGTVSSPVAGTFDYLRVDGPDGFEFFDPGNPDGHFSFQGKPGDYTVYVSQYSGPADDYWGFSGTTSPVTFAASGTLNVLLPIHPLSVRTEKPGGALTPSNVQVDCTTMHPNGWDEADSYGYADNGGQSSFYESDAASAAEDCGIRVVPGSGPIRKARIPGNAATYTHTVTPGVHVSGVLSDGLGHPAPANHFVVAYDAADGQVSGETTTDASGHYDLELDPGTHSIDTQYVNENTALDYRVVTSDQSFLSNTTLNLAPVLDTLTVHARTAGNAPVPSTARLECNGMPQGQTLIDQQYTLVDKPEASDFSLPGTATVEPSGCSLSLDPTVGVFDQHAVDVPDGGGTVTVTLDTGITVTGQLSVPDLATFGNAQVSISPDGHETDSTFTALDGSFSLSGMAAGPATIDVAVADPTWGGVTWQHQQTLSNNDNLALAPNLDYLVLYLLDETGSPGSGTVNLTCSGTQAGDTNTFTTTNVTRSVTDVASIPGYAADASTCHLVVTWSDNTVTTKDIALDKDIATSFTLLKNGVILDGDPDTSNDDDGVADATEAYAPNAGDGDADGTPDYQQADVASLPENGQPLGSGEDYVTVVGPDGSDLVAVTTDDVVTARPAPVGGPPDGSVLPEGLVDFTVAGFAGSNPQVVLHVPSTAGMNGYAVLTPSGWVEMPAADVSFTPTTITLTLHDGGPLDRDPVAGRIRHPGGGTRYDVEVPIVTGVAATPPNDKGWYGSNVTVHWSVTDDKDSITPPADTVVSTEGDDVAALAATESCDRRGNCVTGKIQHLKIDKTKPVVNLTGPTQGATYVIGAAPARQCTGTDPGGSGVIGGACDVTVVGNTAAAGTLTLTARATDRAGNTATKTLTYKQVYKDAGLVAPAAGSKMKVFKQGSTVVVQVKLVNAAGAAVTPAKTPVWLTPKAKGKSKGKVNQPVSSVKADKGTVLVKRGTVWEYRWGTAKAKKGKAYVITVQLDDGTTRTVTVGIG